MDSWWFRMKPRSINKTIKWFPAFAELEGEDWDYYLKDTYSAWNNKKIHPTRRKYIYMAHGEELEDTYATFDDYLSGKFDRNETESNGRNDKTSFEFYGFGYVDEDNKVRVTKVGNLIKEGKINEEILLRQLLKIQFPSPAIKKKPDGKFVFPMQVILEAFKTFDYLNKFEIGLLFGCSQMEDIDTTIDAIKEFRERYNALDSKLDIKEVKAVFKDVFEKAYPKVKNKPETYYSDYADALVRCLEYTGLFSQRGRGLYVKLFIPEHSKLKVELLQDKYEFIYNPEEDFSTYMEWFGDPYNIDLPWETKENRKLIINRKVDLLKQHLDDAQYKLPDKLDLPELEETINKLAEVHRTDEKETLIEYESLVSNELTSLNEKLFVNYYSKTKEVRDEIYEKFVDILEGNEDMAALWLEVNTWKSLVAMNGNHVVKRNFKIEEDLSPKAFAPGIGNTPDMELYNDNYIILPEVSLMTGVRQWEHEGSSVIDHVFKFIEKYEDKNVLGLFISSSMNIRTIWQFFILNQESWIGKPVPVIPITIKQYIEIIEHVYKHDLEIDAFIGLMDRIQSRTMELDTFKVWEERIARVIGEWKGNSV